MKPLLNRARCSELAVAVIACLVAAGCSSLIGPSNPPPQIYRLNPDMSLSPARSAVAWQLSVARPDTSRALDTDRIALLRGSAMDYYADAQWNDSTPRLMQSLLVQAFDRSGRVQAATSDSALRADMILTTELRDFDAQYDSGNAAPNVVIDVQVKMVDPNGKVIASTEFRQTARATQDSVSGVVGAFDRSMTAALAQIVDWALQATPH